jgi:[protein-PII] uridylyltransferase
VLQYTDVTAPSVPVRPVSGHRQHLEQARARAAEVLERDGGVAACQAMCDGLDALVRRVFDTIEAPPGTAVLATGGWGRRDTCPYSDVDLLVLTAGPATDAHRAFAEDLLYPLWDSGLEVGHAVRSLSEALELVANDLATATALMDARPLAGELAPAHELLDRVPRAIRRRGDANAFVAKLIAEKTSRHAKFGDTLYLLEPNLKHGQGALRDLCTGLWAARARWRVRDFADLVPLGAATARQAATLTSARELLLRIRVALHLAARRRQDQLTFEMQEAIAPRFYPDARVREGEIRPAVAPAVEELMRRYFLHAKAVVHETDRLLERALVPAQRAPKIAKVDASFLAWNGQLSVADPRIFRERPSEMIRLFGTALDLGLPVYGHTKELVAERVAVDAGRLGADPEAHAAFLALLTDARDARQPSLLEEMHDLGLLSAIMPEFAPCTGRVQHDLYHVYTVDQHQLYAVALLKRIARGELKQQASALTEAYRRLSGLRSLYLGTLLHDVGKPLGKGHSEKGARLAAVIGRRLGLDDAEVARAEFLVRHHLLMSHLSQRRDLDDPSLIEKFARVVKDEETLRELYLLTYCDTSMTAPGNLTDWKAMLLNELYARTRSFLRRGPDRANRSSLAERRRRRVAELLGEPPADVDAWLAAVPDRTVSTVSPRVLAALRRLERSREAAGTPVAVEVTVRRGASEVLVVAPDAPGLLSLIAGVFTANRVEVVGAQIHSRPGLALDVFTVRDRAGRPIPPGDPRWAAVEADLGRLLTGGETVASLVERKREKAGLPRRLTPEVPTEVEIDNDASDGFTVIDVYTQDRPGVLYAITRTLSELGLDIGLSKVATEADRVADIFYVRDRDGRKIVEEARLGEIASRLRQAL